MDKVIYDPNDGRILVVLHVSSDGVKTYETPNSLDITNHPQKDEIIKNPHLHKIVQKSVVKTKDTTPPLPKREKPVPNST